MSDKSRDKTVSDDNTSRPKSSVSKAKSSIIKSVLSSISPPRQIISAQARKRKEDEMRIERENKLMQAKLQANAVKSGSSTKPTAYALAPPPPPPKASRIRESAQEEEEDLGELMEYLVSLKKENAAKERDNQDLKSRLSKIKIETKKYEMTISKSYNGSSGKGSNADAKSASFPKRVSDLSAKASFSSGAKEHERPAAPMAESKALAPFGDTDPQHTTFGYDASADDALRNDFARGEDKREVNRDGDGDKVSSNDDMVRRCDKEEEEMYGFDEVEEEEVGMISTLKIDPATALAPPQEITEGIDFDLDSIDPDSLEDKEFADMLKEYRILQEMRIALIDRIRRAQQAVAQAEREETVANERLLAIQYKLIPGIAAAVSGKPPTVDDTSDLERQLYKLQVEVRMLEAERANDLHVGPIEDEITELRAERAMLHGRLMDLQDAVAKAQSQYDLWKEQLQTVAYGNASARLRDAVAVLNNRLMLVRSAESIDKIESAALEIETAMMSTDFRIEQLRNNVT